MDNILISVVVSVIVSLVITEIRCRIHLETIDNMARDMLEDVKKMCNECIDMIEARHKH